MFWSKKKDKLQKDEETTLRKIADMPDTDPRKRKINDMVREEMTQMGMIKPVDPKTDTTVITNPAGG